MWFPKVCLIYFANISWVRLFVLWTATSLGLSSCNSLSAWRSLGTAWCPQNICWMNEWINEHVLCFTKVWQSLEPEQHLRIYRSPVYNRSFDHATTTEDKHCNLHLTDKQTRWKSLFKHVLGINRSETRSQGVSFLQLSDFLHNSMHCKGGCAQDFITCKSS